MKNKVIILGVSGLMAMAMLASPASVFGAEPPAPSTDTNAPAIKHKKHDIVPYHGKVAAVDNKAKTVTVGTLVLEVSNQTHIIKDGQPAILDQVTVGEMVAGVYRKSTDGKLHAISIHVGSHVIKPRKEMEGTTAGTNSSGK